MESPPGAMKAATIFSNRSMTFSEACGLADREVTRPIAVDERIIEAARVELRMAVGDASAGPAAGPVVLVIEPDGGPDLLCLVERGIHRLPERLLQIQPPIHAETRVGQGGVHALVRHHANLLAASSPDRAARSRTRTAPGCTRRRLAPELDNLLDRRREKPPLRCILWCRLTHESL